MKEDVAIGIDLGTSNSCVAAVVGGRPRVLANAFGERTTASVVAFGESGAISVGNQAKARVILDPMNTVSSAKRLIGRYFFSEEVRKARAISRYEIVEGPGHSVRIQVRNEEFSLPEISAFILKEMKQIAEQALGHPVSKAVITVPAYFNDNQRQATKDAGKIAGLDVLRLVNEPTAAALAYGYGKGVRQRVAVYDLGGGTFDVSVLEIGADVFEVLSTCGDTFLGGDDFDDRIIDLLAERFQQEHKVNVRTDPFAFEKLKAASEKAKIELAESERARIHLPQLTTIEGKPVGLEYELTSTEFQKLVRDLVHRTFKVCDEAMQQASLTVRDLDGVILVGGPTRLPIVRESVKQYFQREPNLDVNPDEVVALGAAIHARSLLSEKADTYLLDVAPLSLRLGIAGGLSETIIERNTPVPVDARRVFTTAQDFQEAVAVRIYQGESRTAEQNALLGEFEFSGYKPGPRGSVKIEVAFAISTEGIVKVSARDPETGVERSTQVKMTSGLSDAEIKKIIARGRASDVRPARAVPRPRAPEPAATLITDDDSEEMVLEPMLPQTPTPGTNSGGAAGDDELFGAVEGTLSEPEDEKPG
jgi:molecular chaperone DnaK